MSLPSVVRLALLLWLCAAGRAQAEPAPAPPPSIFPLIATAAPEDKVVLQRALSVPPEFAAEALVRTAAHAKPAARKALLDVAWSLSDKALERFPAVPVAADLRAGTTADRFGAAGLDRLSLQSGVITALAEVDPPTALLRFRSLSLAPLPAHTDCDAEALADPAPYYEAAQAAMGQLPPAERHALFLQLAASARNAMQVAPTLRLFRALPTAPAADRARLVGALAKMLDRIRGDDMAFSKSSATVLAEVPLVLATLEPTDPAAAAFKAALRNYLLANFQAARCKANVEGEVFAQEAQTLRGDPALVGVQADQVDDVHRAAVVQEPVAAPAEAAPLPGEEYYVDGWKLAQQILDDPQPAASKAEHLQAMQRYLDRVRFARETDTPAFDRYRSRVGALRRLADVLPEGELKQGANDALFELLENSPLYSVDRSAWFQDARFLVDASQETGAPGSVLIARKLAASSNPVFRLYGALAQRERTVALR